MDIDKKLSELRFHALQSKTNLSKVEIDSRAINVKRNQIIDDLGVLIELIEMEAIESQGEMLERKIAAARAV